MTVSGLAAGETYYFAATAYNSMGIESDYSSEIIYTTAAGKRPTVITLTSPTNGATARRRPRLSRGGTSFRMAIRLPKVQFLSNGTLAMKLQLHRFVTDLGNLSAGVYSYSARLVYDGGLTVDSATAGVTVALAGRTCLSADLLC